MRTNGTVRRTKNATTRSDNDRGSRERGANVREISIVHLGGLR